MLIYDSLRQAAGLAPVSPEARDTYRVILGFSWSNKYQFTPPIVRRTIAQERALDERSVSRHIAELESKHYLRIEPSDGQASIYIPLVTYQMDTAYSPANEADQEHTAASHSPANKADYSPADEADTATSHSPAQADSQPEPLTSMTRVPDQPLTPVSRVSAEPEAAEPMNSRSPSRVSRVPININSSCSSGLISSEFKPEKQQLLQHINNLLTGTFQVLPHAAQDLVATASPADILGWLHALIEARLPADRLPRVLVANILRDHRLAPSCPPERRAERAQREAAWGLSMSTEISDSAAGADGQGDADFNYLADLLAVPRQDALDAIWSARAAGWGPRFTHLQIVSWTLYASMPSSATIGSPAHFVAAKIRQAADCPDLPLWKADAHRSHSRTVEADPVWARWASEHQGELVTLRRLERAIEELDPSETEELPEEELP